MNGLRLQKIFNFYDSESELSILNAKRRLEVSDDLLKVIKKAIKFSLLTNGRYDISLGKNMLERKTGKDGNFQKEGLKKMRLLNRQH